MAELMNNRILIVDDNASIHNDFDKILAPDDGDQKELDSLFREVFGDEESGLSSFEGGLDYQLFHAYQGEEAYRMVLDAEKAGNPFALLFMDVRMPPGWDGIETISKIWAEVPDVEVVICTAYSDYSWEGILEELGTTDKLQFLRKPFDIVSIKQMALALTKKWDLARKSREYTSDLERAVAERTRELKEKITQLEKAMQEISTLKGILPMCSYCHKIRDDGDYWHRVDEYIQSHSVADISHGVCPECYEKFLEPMLKQNTERSSMR